MAATRMSAPPASCSGVSGSERISAASSTVTTGSSVESVAAVVGPTRASPAKNVTMGSTVEIAAIATTAAHPAGDAGNVGPRQATTAPKTTAA